MTLKLHLSKFIITPSFLVFLFLSNWAHSQCGELFMRQDSLIKNLQVETRNAYLSEIKDNQVSNHSSLAYFMSFNKLGNITRFHSYDTTGTYPVEEYKYLWNNQLSEIEINFKNRPDKNYKVKNEYNEQGIKIRERMIQHDKTIFRTDFDYDKKGRLKKKAYHYLRVPATRAKRQKYFYDKNNRAIRLTAKGFTYIANEKLYDENGNHTYTYRIDRNGNQIPYLEKEYNAQNQLIKATNYGPYLLLCSAKKEVIKEGEKEEIMIVKYSYLDNGLLETEEVVVNGSLAFFWEYEYTFFEQKN